MGWGPGLPELMGDNEPRAGGGDEGALSPSMTLPLFYEWWLLSCTSKLLLQLQEQAVHSVKLLTAVGEAPGALTDDSSCQLVA